MDPSITSTNGASSLSSSASRNGLRNSSPPSVGDSTLLCRWTFGRPGIAPSRTSSMPGWPAAVMETVSPSQLIPSEIQRMCTSSTPLPTCSTPMDQPSCRQLSVIQLQRVHEQLLTAEQLEVQPVTRRALQGEAVQPRLGAARAAAPGGRDVLDAQLGALGGRALGDQREGER